MGKGRIDIYFFIHKAGKSNNLCFHLSIEVTYIYIYTYTHTHTHRYINGIHMYIYTYI